MTNFIEIIKGYVFELAEPSVVLLVGIITILVTKNSNKHNIARDRLSNAYHPLFLAIESYLFKKIDKTSAELFVKKYVEIESAYSLYIYPSLRYRVHRLSTFLLDGSNEDKINEEWHLICYYVEKEYDKLCKRSHMPLRSLTYRLNNNQFSSKHSLYWGLFRLFLPSILFFTICLLMSILISIKS